MVKCRYILTTKQAATFDPTGSYTYIKLIDL